MPIDEFKDEALPYIELVQLYIGTEIFIAATTAPEEGEYTVDEAGMPVTRTYIPIGYDRFKISTSYRDPTQVLEFTMMVADPSLLDGVDLVGYRIRIYRTLADLDHTDPANTEQIFDGSILAWQFNGHLLSLKVAMFTKWFKIFPRGSYTYFCRHRFKGVRCGYTGTETSCSKNLNACYTGNFCGWPSLARIQRRNTVYG